MPHRGISLGQVLPNSHHLWQLHVWSCVKIWVDSPKEFQNDGGLSLGVCLLPQILAPPSSETMHQMQICFRGARMVRIFAIIMPSLMGLGLRVMLYCT